VLRLCFWCVPPRGPSRSLEFPLVLGPLSFVSSPLSVVSCLWSLVHCPLSVVRFAGVTDQRMTRRLVAGPLVAPWASPASVMGRSQVLFLDRPGSRLDRSRVSCRSRSIGLVRLGTLSGCDRPQSDRPPVLEGLWRSDVLPADAVGHHVLNCSGIFGAKATRRRRRLPDRGQCRQLPPHPAGGEPADESPIRCKIRAAH